MQLAVTNAPGVGGLTALPTLTVSNNDFNATQIVLWLLNWLIWIAGVAALIYLIWGGIQFITAGGDSDKVTKARNTILYAVIGIVVVLLALVIFNVASNLIG